MDPSIAKKTQDTLGKVIKKPPLTEKLLGKPPFRFLHDIITEVVRNTGFLKGLYTADEMDSAKVKEKEAKILFLQKAIDVVGMITGQLSVRPSKIVAGHEPEKTNEFLQAMGTAILHKKSSTGAVKKVLAGEKPGKEPSDNKRKDSRTGSGSRDKEKSKEQDKEKSKDRDRSRDREKEDDKDKHKQGDSSRRRDSSSNKADSSDRKKRDESAKREKEKEKQSDRGREKEKEKEKLQRKDDDVDSPDVATAAAVDGESENGEAPANRIPRPSSAKGQRRRPSGEGEDLQDSESDGANTDEQPRPTEQMNGVLHDEDLPPQVIKSRSMARPSSARPAPPKIKKQQEDLEEQIARIGSGKQVASVIVDDGKEHDDEDDTFVVEDAHAVQNDVDVAPTGEVAEDDGEHGGLVRKILETKKELEGGRNQETRPKQERQAPIISDAARKKERELAQKEIEKLRTSIQTLTRSANPLGKIMDYIQEDMDSMQKELDLWRRENKEHEIALRREESITQNEIAPLKSQLDELDTEITEMVDRISTVKCNILRNDEKVQKMLSSVSLTSR
nr:TRAF3-interacting protein 1-like isoform X2 [Pocillopora verrucosa]